MASDSVSIGALGDGISLRGSSNNLLSSLVRISVLWVFSITQPLSLSCKGVFVKTTGQWLTT